MMSVTALTKCQKWRAVTTELGNLSDVAAAAAGEWSSLDRTTTTATAATIGPGSTAAAEREEEEEEEEERENKERFLKQT
jgi:hypothetical protein